MHDTRIPDRWNLRVRTYGRGAYIEVPVGLAMETPDLAWVIDGDWRKSYDADHLGPRTIGADGRIRRRRRGQSVILVPADVWDRRVASRPLRDD